MVDIDSIIKQNGIVVGLKQVVKGILKEEIETVLIATDCDSFVEEKILATGKKVDIIKVFTGRQLGNACNIDVEAAAVGIVKQSDKKTQNK